MKQQEDIRSMVAAHPPLITIYLTDPTQSNPSNIVALQGSEP